MAPSSGDETAESLEQKTKEVAQKLHDAMLNIYNAVSNTPLAKPYAGTAEVTMFARDTLQRHFQELTVLIDQNKQRGAKIDQSIYEVQNEAAELKSKLEEKLRDVADTEATQQEQTAVLAEKIDAFTRQSDHQADLERQLKELREENEKLKNSQAQTLSAAAQQHHEDVGRLRQQNDDLNKRLSEQESQIRTRLEDELKTTFNLKEQAWLVQNEKSLNEERTKAQIEVNQLFEKSLQAFKEVVDASEGLRNTEQNLGIHVQNFSNGIADIKTEVNNLKSTLDEFSTQLKSTHAHHISNITEANKTFDDWMAKWGDRIASAADRSDEDKALFKDLRELIDTVAAVEGMITDVQKSLSELSADDHPFMESFESLKRSISNINASIIPQLQPYREQETLGPQRDIFTVNTEPTQSTNEPVDVDTRTASPTSLLPPPSLPVTPSAVASGLSGAGAQFRSEPQAGEKRQLPSSPSRADPRQTIRHDFPLRVRGSTSVTSQAVIDEAHRYRDWREDPLLSTRLRDYKDNVIGQAIIEWTYATHSKMKLEMEGILREVAGFRDIFNDSNIVLQLFQLGVPPLQRFLNQDLDVDALRHALEDDSEQIADTVQRAMADAQAGVEEYNFQKGCRRLQSERQDLVAEMQQLQQEVQNFDTNTDDADTFATRHALERFVTEARERIREVRSEPRLQTQLGSDFVLDVQNDLIQLQTLLMDFNQKDTRRQSKRGPPKPSYMRPTLSSQATASPVETSLPRSSSKKVFPVSRSQARRGALPTFDPPTKPAKPAALTGSSVRHQAVTPQLTGGLFPSAMQPLAPQITGPSRLDPATPLRVQHTGPAVLSSSTTPFLQPQHSALLPRRGSIRAGTARRASATTVKSPKHIMATDAYTTWAATFVGPDGRTDVGRILAMIRMPLTWTPERVAVFGQQFASALPQQPAQAIWLADEATYQGSCLLPRFRRGPYTFFADGRAGCRTHSTNRPNELCLRIILVDNVQNPRDTDVDSFEVSRQTDGTYRWEVIEMAPEVDETRIRSLLPRSIWGT